MCFSAGVHPFDARRHHVDAWIRLLSTEPLARTGRPLASTSIARRLSAVSAFYDYGIGVEVLSFSPVANVRRPKVSDDSTTVGLSAEELVALLDVPKPTPLVGALWCRCSPTTASASTRLYRQTPLTTRTSGGTEFCGSPARAAARRLSHSLLQRCEPSMLTSTTTHPMAGPLFLDRAGTNRLAYSTAFRPDTPPRSQGGYPGGRPDHAALAAPHLRHRGPRSGRSAPRRAGRSWPPRSPHDKALRPEPSQPSIGTRRTCSPLTCAVLTARRHDDRTHPP